MPSRPWTGSSAWVALADKESLAWESMAKAYRDTNFDVYRLAELRDPKELGRLLHDHSP